MPIKKKQTTKKRSVRKRAKQDDLSKYAGEWVAVLNNGKVVAHGKKLEDIAAYVVRDAKDKTPIEKVPVLFKVPRKDEGSYIIPSCFIE